MVFSKLIATSAVAFCPHFASAAQVKSRKRLRGGVWLETLAASAALPSAPDMRELQTKYTRQTCNYKDGIAQMKRLHTEKVVEEAMGGMTWESQAVTGKADITPTKEEWQDLINKGASSFLTWYDKTMIRFEGKGDLKETYMALYGERAKATYEAYYVERTKKWIFSDGTYIMVTPAVADTLEALQERRLNPSNSVLIDTNQDKYTCGYCRVVVFLHVHFGFNFVNFKSAKDSNLFGGASRHLFAYAKSFENTEREKADEAKSLKGKAAEAVTPTGEAWIVYHDAVQVYAGGDKVEADTFLSTLTKYKFQIEQVATTPVFADKDQLTEALRKGKPVSVMKKQEGEKTVITHKVGDYEEVTRDYVDDKAQFTLEGGSTNNFAGKAWKLQVQSFTEGMLKGAMQVTGDLAGAGAGKDEISSVVTIKSEVFKVRSQGTDAPNFEKQGVRGKLNVFAIKNKKPLK